VSTIVLIGTQLYPKKPKSLKLKFIEHFTTGWHCNHSYSADRQII
jgi:hypothetical protein